MIKGLRYNGLMTDIWSSGVVLFAMVAGCLPFEDKNTSLLYKKIQTPEYTMPPIFSDKLKDFIEHILVVDPKQRYNVADIRAHPWYQIVPPQEKIGTLIGKTEIQIDEGIIEKVT
jgi:5'-AMP-activated protein kinase catalytic alpha subunit